MRPDRARRRSGGGDRSTALTIAARGAAAASRAAQDSRPTPSSNLAAAPRRRRRASPGVSATLNNGRRRRAPATAAAAWRVRGAQLQGPESRRRGPGGCGGAPRPRLPAAGPAPEGPRSLGARHQVIPQEASRIGPGAQDGICISMAEKAPQGLKTDSGNEESGSARPSAGQVLRSSWY